MDHQRRTFHEVRYDCCVESESDIAIFVPPRVDDRLFELVAWQDHQIAIGVGDSDLRFVGKAIGDQIALDDIAMIIFEIKKHGVAPALLPDRHSAEMGDGVTSLRPA